MTAAGQLVSVRRVTDDTDCRRCGSTIERGQRAALVLGAGLVHVRCLLGHGRDSGTP